MESERTVRKEEQLFGNAVPPEERGAEGLR